MKYLDPVNITSSFRGHQAPEVALKCAKRLQDVSEAAPRHVATFQRAYEGKSLRAAINAFCVECMGFDASEVRHCTAPACPLFAVRPGQEKKGGGQ